MTKLMTLLLGALLFISPQLTLAQGEKLTPELYAALATGAPHTVYPIVVLLAEQAPVADWHDTWRRQGLNPTQRQALLLPQLRALAQQTQPQLWARLRQLAPAVDPASITGRWVVNAIELQALPEAIWQIAQWPEVAEVAWEQPYTPALSPGQAPSPPAPNGREPGLTAINAPAMWQLGYSGYGRLAMVMDSGPNFAHPALRATFLGNTRPINQSWIGGTPEPVACDDHGTHVAGTIVGLDRLTRDTIGVAFNANWIGAVANLTNDDCDAEASTLNLFEWALDPDNNPATTNDAPDVINCSFGRGPGNCSNIVLNVSLVTEAAGIAVVWAAGNNGPGPSTISEQGNTVLSLVNTFTVGALNANTTSLPIADFSGLGPSVCEGTDALRIKPEVAAPGFQVRSSILNGGYANFNGTSMAAPHVSGALLLLKEAFPELTGEDLKYALYESAVDLGEPGEDNTFGRGIIDVFAAYEYLIQEGHTPTPPAPNRINALVAGINTPGFDCNQLSWDVVIENGGEETLTAFELEVQIALGNLNHTATQPWTGSLAPGERATVAMSFDASQLPFLTGNDLPSGIYRITLRINLPDDDRPLNNRQQFTLDVVGTPYPTLAVSELANQTVCAGGRALLQADYDGPGVVRWLSGPTVSSPLLGTGPTFLTPPLTEPTTYYTDVRFEGIGLPSPTALQEAPPNSPFAGSLTFSVHNHVELRNVRVHPTEQGSLRIRLCDNFGLCEEKTIIVIPGQRTLALNWPLVPGREYTLLKVSGPRLLFNNQGVSFPYSYPGLLTITGSNLGGNYYYFYNWDLRYRYDCERPAITVTPGAGEAPEANFIAPDSLNLLANPNLAFADASMGATSWQWNFGDGATSTEPNPTHTYTQPGTYTVTLVAGNAGGCTDAVQRSLTVYAGPTSTRNPTPVAWDALRVFPNPANRQLWVAAPTLQEGRMAQVQVVNLLGETVSQGNYPVADGLVHLSFPSGLPAGLYVVTVRQDERRYVGKATLVN